MKLEYAEDNAYVDTTTKLNLKGITSEIVSSLGVCQGEFTLNDQTSIFHPVHLVPDDFPIACHGILGKDFLMSHKAVLNYNIPLLVLRIENQTFSFPIDNPNVITVPPRSEFLANVKVNMNQPKLCLQKELSPGLIVGNSIVHPKNGSCKINVINSNETAVTFSAEQLEFDDLSNYDVIAIQSCNEQSRLKLIESEIDLEYLNSEERRSILDICREFHDLFYLKGDKLTHTDAIQHSIPLTAERPIFVKPYRLPIAQHTEIKSQIDKMLDEDVIEPSNSPYNSPILVVPKKPDSNGQKKWRLVVDFRKLNDVTVSDAYPLPNITEILDQLGRSKYFSVIDLCSGFHQIPLQEESKPLTAFSFQGHYQYKRLPMGLKGSPATFQRLMNNVLTGLQGLKCFVYLDDIVVYGDNLQTHNARLVEVFERLRKHNLKLQPNKCNFLRKEVTYLGHIISETGIKPDPEKIAAVLQFPVPKDQKRLQSFLGLASYYRRFIKDFSKVAKPLYNLLKKEATFDFSPICHESFNELKEKLTTPPILQYPDFEKEFILTTDASQQAVGAVLSQGVVGKDLPIAYASRTLNKAECNYSTIERELLGIVFGVTHFRPYLFGRKFKIFTDHRPLVYLFSVSNPSSRLMRFRLKLEEFEYEIQYKPGKQNTNADALSRMFKISNVSPKSEYDNYLDEIKKKIIINKNIIDTDSRSQSPYRIKFTSLDSSVVNNAQGSSSRLTEFQVIKENNTQILHSFIKEKPEDKPDYANVFHTLLNLKTYLLQSNIDSVSISAEDIKQEHLKLSTIRTMLRFIFLHTNIKISLCHQNNTKELSADQIKTILQENHCGPIGGHQGVNRTFKRIKQRYQWPKMYRDIKKFIRNCETCQKTKISKKTKAPMVITTTSSYPFEKIFLDIVGPLNQTESFNKYLLTCQDDLSKFSVAIPIPNQEANTVAKAFARDIICRYGTPKYLVTDQGTNFMSSIFKETCKILQIKQIHCTSYHPQSNGSLERSHRTLVEYLRNFINRDMDNWDEFIPFATFTYNTTPHTSTEFTPFELLYGHKVVLPSALTKDPELCYSYDDYYNELKSRLQHTHEIARENLVKKKEEAKTYYDRNVSDIKFKEGDKVLLSNEAQPKGKSRKLLPLYTGPYEIIKTHSDVNYTIRVNKKLVKVHVNRLKRFYE